MRFLESKAKCAHGPSGLRVLRPARPVRFRRATVAAMSTSIKPRTTTLSCGLDLLTERNESQRSASVCWLVPGGFAYDPLGDGDGWASMISEYLLRGAGGLDSRQFSDAMDRLGGRRSITSDTYFMRVSLTLAGEQLAEGLALLVSLIRDTHFEPDAFAAVQSLCLQELQGLEDDPSQLSVIRLDEIRLPPPFHRHGLGVESHLRQATTESLSEHFRSLALPGGSILAVSGDVDHEAVRDQLESLLEGWSGQTPIIEASAEPVGGQINVERPTSQSHLAMGLTAPVASDDDAMPFQAAAVILGGGASSRLFTEVRERRGLAYSIGGRYEAGRSLGNFSVIAGTTPQRIQETIDAINTVLVKFAEGVSDEEVTRVRTQLRSSALMQMEHGPARARRLALDTFRLGHPRSVQQMLAEFEALDTPRIRDVVARRMGSEWRSAATRCIVGPAA